MMLVLGMSIWGAMVQAGAATWSLTPSSNVGFHIDSLGMTLVKGKFNRVQSTMDFDVKAPERSSTSFVMDVDSLSLSKSSLKNMIMGEDLFYAARYKTVSFKSTGFKSLGNNKYIVAGNLTLRGVTRPVKFNTTLKPDPANPELISTEGSTVINRSDFGMKKATGGVGEKVNLQVSGQWKLK
ncbi:YceI family protein [Acinetobacter sp. WZC-1]|uniref:YceI family protein n=1 Tax=Acinetobacter sp. WZC-1 TaxID=3459034 RepID=UPI00403D8D14